MTETGVTADPKGLTTPAIDAPKEGDLPKVGDAPKVEDSPKVGDAANSPGLDPLMELRKLTPFPVEDPAWMEDPFPVLELEMLEATGDLRNGATRPPAQVTQPRIISRLDLLIEQLKRNATVQVQAAVRRRTLRSQPSRRRFAMER